MPFCFYKKIKAIEWYQQKIVHDILIYYLILAYSLIIFIRKSSLGLSVVRGNYLRGMNELI